MKKFIVSSIIVLLLLLALVVVSRDTDVPVWEENALKLSKSLDTISGHEPIVGGLTDYTNFDWDMLYSFQPYFPKETIYEIVGYEWADISETVSEGMNQIVFLNDGEVVCYIYGYPDRYNLYFDFGYHRDGYLLLNYEDKSKFIIRVKDDINYFKLVEE